MAGPPRGAQSTTAVERAERDAEMWQMRVNGVTQSEIARRLGITQQAVSKALRRAFDRRQATSIAEYRAVELDKLDRLERAALAVMARRHYVVSGGNIVMIHDEEAGTDVPLLDDGPILAAIKALIGLSRRYSDLLGLDAPTKIDVNDIKINYTIDGIDMEALR